MTNKSTQRRNLNTRAPKVSPWNSGFTLIEMLVAVLLLTLAIAGPLTISSKALTVALVAKDQTIAFYLAQDAVEFVRFARDTNTLRNSLDWLRGDGVTTINLGPCIAPNVCYFDSLAVNPPEPTQCASNICGPLFLQPSHSYNYNSGTRTIFTRSVSITNPNGSAADEAVLRVTVRWSDIAGVTRSVTVTEDLFNWQ